MGEVCVFTPEHVAEVAALFLRGMKGVHAEPSERLQDYFCEIFFANPWASAELPSLVYLDGSHVVGFLGVIPREMELRGRPIRVAIATQFTIDRQRHRGFGAMELLRRYLRGSQDLSFTDGAGEGVHRLWAAAGAQVARLYSFNWLRMLRPGGTVLSFRGRMTGSLRVLADVASVAAAPFDFLSSKIPHPALRPPVSECISTPLNAEELYNLMQEIGWREALRPSYDLASFKWLMAQVAANRIAGELSMTAVHKPDGELSGYYICQVKPGSYAHLLQIGTRRHDHIDHVLGALFRDAWRLGASSVKGHAIPSALVNLTNHYCLFRQPNTSVLFQARDPAVADAIFRGDAALSRLDGECWLRFAGDTWT